jgi:excisionase family DNA binding protein
MSQVTRESLIPGNLVGIREAARLLGLSPRTIRNAIHRDELPATMIGGRVGRSAGRGLGYRIRTEDLQKWFFGEIGKE